MPTICRCGGPGGPTQRKLRLHSDRLSWRLTSPTDTPGVLGGPAFRRCRKSEGWKRVEVLARTRAGLCFAGCLALGFVS